MKKMPDNMGALGRGLLIAVLAAGLLWQGSKIGAALYRASAIDSSVERWEEAHRTEEPETPESAEKPMKPEETSPGSPQPVKPGANERQGNRGKQRQTQKTSGNEQEEDKYAELKKEPLFGPPLPQAPPPTLTAIIGKSAIVNEQLVKVNDNVAGYKVLEILSDKVVLEKDEKKTELTLFAGGGGGAPSRPPQPPPGAIKKEKGPDGKQPGNAPPANMPSPEMLKRMEVLGGPFGMPANGNFVIDRNGAGGDPFAGPPPGQ